MKKLLLATFGVFFLSAGIALAGGGMGGCAGYYHEKEMTSIKTNDTIVLLEVKDKRVELVKSLSTDKRYNVTNTNGELLSVNLSEEDLSLQYPELYKALEG